MAKVKIVKISDMSIASEYDSSDSPNGQADYGGPWGDPEIYKHINVPGGVDPECAEAYDAQASGDHEGVSFTADSAGEVGNDIVLTFDGVKDIDTVISDSGSSVSHDGTGTDVLASGSLQLSGGGLQIKESTALADAKTQTKRDAKLVELRKQRDERADRADNEIRKHEDGDTNAAATEAGWRTQRVSLRDVTDSYRTNSDPAHADYHKGTSSLDSFADDLNDFTGWPADPT